MFPLILPASLSGAAPRDARPLDALEWPLNYRVHLEGAAKVKLCDELTLALDPKDNHDIAVEHPAKGAPVLRVWIDGKLVCGPEEVPMLVKTGAKDFPDARVNLGGDFTAMATFEATRHRTLFSKCAPTGNWQGDAKALFIPRAP